MAKSEILNQVYDCVVVGAGIEGLSTACRLVQLRKTVLLLEQFPLYHTRGSSSGLSRITRLAYKKLEYVPLVQASLIEWKKLEAEFETKLYRETGVLVVGHEDGFDDYKKSIEQTNSEYIRLSHEMLREKYGNILSPPKQYGGFWEAEGGLLYANRCLQAYQVHGSNNALLGCKLDFLPGGPLTLFVAEAIFVVGWQNFGQDSSGPWTPGFLKEKLQLKLPVEIRRTFACYWRENCPNQYSADNGVPAVLFPEEDGQYFFKPTDEYPGLLYFGLHTGYTVNPDFPDHINNKDRDEYIERSRKFAQKMNLNIDTTKPAVMEPCLYQESIDDDFILDAHPLHKNVVFGTGFSGHGFKLAPVVGDILAHLAIGLKSEYYRPIFSLDRFQNRMNFRSNM